MIKLLSKYMKDIDWKLILSMNEDMTFNVTAVPIPKVKDEALKDMAPVIIRKQTLVQLDEITSEQLENAMASVQGLVSNVVEFEKSVEAQEKLTKFAKDNREAKKKKKEQDDKAAKDAAPGMFSTPAMVETEPESEVPLDI
jgi:hypothetical protein